MKKYNLFDLFAATCKGEKKFGLLISFDPDHNWNEISQAAPYLNLDKDIDIFLSGNGYFMFDDEAEMEKIYNLTVGDDGPTESNSYSGPARVFACTCNPDGELMTENT
jgi:hypothetical protein